MAGCAFPVNLTALPNFRLVRNPGAIRTQNKSDMGVLVSCGYLLLPTAAAEMVGLRPLRDVTQTVSANATDVNNVLYGSPAHIAIFGKSVKPCASDPLTESDRRA